MATGVVVCGVGGGGWWWVGVEGGGVEVPTALYFFSGTDHRMSGTLAHAFRHVGTRSVHMLAPAPAVCRRLSREIVRLDANVNVKGVIGAFSSSAFQIAAQRQRRRQRSAQSATMPHSVHG